jgi:hypothetical protein
MGVRWFTAVVVLGLAFGACSKQDDPDGGGGMTSVAGSGSGGAGRGGGGSGGNAGRGGAAGTGSAAAPAITEAPPAWVRPSDCGGIGNLCPNLSGCAELSTCQLEGNVCIPKLADGATALPGRTAETPYCAAFTCMSFEQASCFCTGEAGKTVRGCSSPAALAGLCAAEESSCRDKACCDGLTCTENASDQPVCRIPCAQASDCTSGCCTDLYDRGVEICAEAAACANPCKKRGDATCNAGSTAGDRCCRGSCVQATNPDYAGCRPTCAMDADCDTGCCVAFADNQGGFCADARYCSCSAVGAPCGGDQDVDCCDDTRCVAFGDTPFTCHSECDASRPCVTGSCRTLSDASASVCYTGGGTAGGGGMGGGAGATGGTGGGRCSAVLEPCGASNTNCCSGLLCIGDEPSGGTCYRTCADPSSCPTECLYLEGFPDGICVE